MGSQTHLSTVRKKNEASCYCVMFCYCHESGCHSPHLLHHTTAAHHPWTTTPIIHCTYDTHFPIHHCTNHTAVTNHSLTLIVSPHLHLIHTHTHISSTLPCTHRKVLFSQNEFLPPLNGHFTLCRFLPVFPLCCLKATLYWACPYSTCELYFFSSWQ